MRVLPVDFRRCWEEGTNNQAVPEEAINKKAGGYYSPPTAKHHLNVYIPMPDCFFFIPGHGARYSQ